MNTDGSRVMGVAMAKMSDHGTLIATINEGRCEVTRMDSLGAIQSSHSIMIDSGTEFTDIMSIGVIDGGPACYLLAQREGYPQTDYYRPYVLIELDSAYQVVLAKQYVNIVGNCTCGSICNAKAYRLADGGYRLSLPQSSNFTCVYGLDQNGDTLFTRMYSDEPDDGHLSGMNSIELSDGTLLLLNSYSQGHLHLMKVTSSGDLLWSRRYASPNDHGIPFAGVQFGPDSVVIVGVHDQWGFIRSMDLEGNMGWHRRFDIADGPLIYSGLPREIAVSSEGDYLVRLDASGDDLLARFNPYGVIQDVVLLDIPANPWTAFYDDFRVSYDQEEMIAVGSVEYDGAPIWNDSVFVVRIDDLSDLQCYASPHSWYDEPDTSTTTVVEDGGVHWSPWFRTDSVQCSVSETDWTTTAYCLITSVEDEQGFVRMLVYPSVAALGAELFVSINAGRLTQLDVIALDGSILQGVPSGRGTQQCTISTGDLTPGMYVIRGIIDGGGAAVARVIVVD